MTTAQPKPTRVANHSAREYVQRRKPFQGSNCWGEKAGPDRYVVYSYGTHFPMFVYDSGKWYGNKERYSRSTGRQYSQLHPLADGMTYFDTDDMSFIADHGFMNFLTRRLTGAVFISAPATRELEPA